MSEFEVFWHNHELCFFFNVIITDPGIEGMHIPVVCPVPVIQDAIDGINRPGKAERIHACRLNTESCINRLLAAVRIVVIRSISLQITVCVTDPAVKNLIMAGKSH